MDPVGLILLLLRPWMGYDYIVIQVVCWVELPEQRRLCPIFFFKYEYNSVVFDHPKSTRIPWVDWLSTRPSDLGCHSLVSELGLTIT